MATYLYFCIHHPDVLSHEEVAQTRRYIHSLYDQASAHFHYAPVPKLKEFQRLLRSEKIIAVTGKEGALNYFPQNDHAVLITDRESAIIEVPELGIRIPVKEFVIAYAAEGKRAIISEEAECASEDLIKEIYSTPSPQDAAEQYINFSLQTYYNNGGFCRNFSVN